MAPLNSYRTSFEQSNPFTVRRPSSFSQKLFHEIVLSLQLLILKGVSLLRMLASKLLSLFKILWQSVLRVFLPVNIARIKYWSWKTSSKILLGVVYFSIIAEGLRQIVPVLGQRLHKLPGLSFLQDYEATYRLDLAPIFAGFLLLAVWSLWASLLKIWLLDDDSQQYSDSHKLLIATLGSTILSVDAYIFYAALSEYGWGGMFSFSALIATAAYVGVLIFVLYVSHQLHEDLEQLKLKG